MSQWPDLGHGRVTSFFIEKKLKELRRTGLKRSQLSQDQPVADCLLEYCEGFIEVINTVEERIELESRLKVYEEMLANMKAEVARLQANEDRLGGHVESLEGQMTQTSTQITRLEAQVQEKEGRLAIAQKVRVSLESQRKDWLDQLDNLKTESSTLEEQETVTVAARSGH